MIAMESRFAKAPAVIAERIVQLEKENWYVSKRNSRAVCSANILNRHMPLHFLNDARLAAYFLTRFA